MNTIKTTTLVFLAIVACLVLLLMPDSPRVEAPTAEAQPAGADAVPMKRQQSEFRFEAQLPVVPAIDETAPLAVETFESSVNSPTATKSIDWLKALYPELTRIAELEHETADTALAELAPMLSSDDPAVRRAAIEAVGDMTIPTVLPLLSTALGDPNPQLRVAALEALTSQEIETVVGSIEPLLYDPEAEVRLAAIDAISELESESSVYALAGLLSDPDSRIRARAVYALGEIGGESVILYLEQARYDSSGSIRDEAETILLELARDRAN